MDQVRLRDISKFEYGDPVGFLIELQRVEATLPAALPDKLRRLRTNALKPEREMRDAALFCVGMSKLLGVPVRFAPVEAEDFDFVATWRVGDTQHCCPVQLKEMVPEDLNSDQSIDDLFKSLSKYSSIQDLTVAIRWNRSGRFDPGLLKQPQEIKLRGLWVFGCVSDDQSKWALWGDFAKEQTAVGIAYDYPS